MNLLGRFLTPVILLSNFVLIMRLLWKYVVAVTIDQVRRIFRVDFVPTECHVTVLKGVYTEYKAH